MDLTQIKPERTARLATTCIEAGFVPDDQWAKLPAGLSWNEVAAVATDSQDRIYVFNRGPNPLMVFSADGTFIRSWDEKIFARAHGIFIGPDDAIYCTDDLDHTVRKFTT